MKIIFWKTQVMVGKMVQNFKNTGCVFNHDNLISIPGSHGRKRETLPDSCLLMSDTYACLHRQKHIAQTHTQ